jgi:enoyl-CoA hydratase/carnithine racemase
MNEIPLVTSSRVDTENGVLFEIHLNRPNKGNALTLEMLAELRKLIHAIQRDRDIRVVILRGAGKFFCTGGDIQEWGQMAPSEMAEDWILPGIDVFNALAALPQPVIAAMHGHAFGGGLELALAADLRVAAPGIKIGTPEVRLGMIAGWGGIRRLSEMVGVSRARYLTLTGAPIAAETALEWGLVHSVSARTDSFDEEVRALAGTIAKNAPIAMHITKGLLSTMHQDLRYAHAAAVSQTAATEDCKEGTAAFREKRSATFRNK